MAKLPVGLLALDEPHGIAYAPKSNLIAVACGRQGTIRNFTAGEFSPVLFHFSGVITSRSNGIVLSLGQGIRYAEIGSFSLLGM